MSCATLVLFFAFCRHKDIGTLRIYPSVLWIIMVAFVSKICFLLPLTYDLGVLSNLNAEMLILIRTRSFLSIIE